MAITSADILEAVNENLRRTETDIDAQLINALKRISAFGNFLFDIETQTLSEGDNTLSFPEDYKTLQYIRLTSTDSDPSVGSEVDKKNRLFLIGFSDYLNRIGFNECKGTPTQYAVFNDTIRLYPLADGEYNAELYYSKFHPRSTTILFDEEFRETIEALTTYNFAKKIGESKSISLWAAVSSNLLNTHKDKEKVPIRITRYSRY